MPQAVPRLGTQTPLENLQLFVRAWWPVGEGMEAPPWCQLGLVTPLPLPTSPTPDQLTLRTCLSHGGCHGLWGEGPAF